MTLITQNIETSAWPALNIHGHQAGGKRPFNSCARGGGVSVGAQCHQCCHPGCWHLPGSSGRTFGGFCSQALGISENPIQLLRKLGIFLKFSIFLKYQEVQLVQDFSCVHLFPALLRPGDEEGSSASELKITEGVAVPGAPSVCVRFLE